MDNKTFNQILSNFENEKAKIAEIISKDSYEVPLTNFTINLAKLENETVKYWNDKTNTWVDTSTKKPFFAYYSVDKNNIDFYIDVKIINPFNNDWNVFAMPAIVLHNETIFSNTIRDFQDRLDSVIADIKDGIDSEHFLINSLSKEYKDFKYSIDYSDGLHLYDSSPSDIRIDILDPIYNLDNLGGRYHSIHIAKNEIEFTCQIKTENFDMDDNTKLLQEVCSILKEYDDYAEICKTIDNSFTLAEFNYANIINNFVVKNGSAIFGNIEIS